MLVLERVLIFGGGGGAHSVIVKLLEHNKKYHPGTGWMKGKLCHPPDQCWINHMAKAAYVALLG
jgi:hypothetical protein